MTTDDLNDQRQEAELRKQKLVTMMRHELRTSINHIVGYSEILQEEAEEQGQLGFIPDLQRIRVASGDLLRYVEERLDSANTDFDRKSVGQLRHELRTPLNPIIGYAEMLEEDAEEQGLSYFIPDLQKIRSAAQRLLAVVNEGPDLTDDVAPEVDLSVIGMMVSDRLLGLLAYVMGKFDDAALHFEDALDFYRKAGYRPELAWTYCDYADALRKRGGDGDHEKAISLLDQSLTITRDLGMRPLTERVLARRELLTR